MKPVSTFSRPPQSEAISRPIERRLNTDDDLRADHAVFDQSAAKASPEDQPWQVVPALGLVWRADVLAVC
jgi:hypothetical protein